ncbi:MAG: hypothetical protein ACJA06_000437 [Halocynthiibacter sp.]|jgi:hypothetical protein
MGFLQTVMNSGGATGLLAVILPAAIGVFLMLIAVAFLVISRGQKRANLQAAETQIPEVVLPAGTQEVQRAKRAWAAPVAKKNVLDRAIALLPSRSQRRTDPFINRLEHLA